MTTSDTQAKVETPLYEHVEHLSKQAVDVTEDEAALYDRQIRLWGLEAQSRMRNAHVLVSHIGGLATEVIKNVVLSGIGTLSVVDPGKVSPEDLAAGFFFREEDIGRPRVEAALPRIKALNPLVRIRTLTDEAVLRDEKALAEVDLICATQGQRAELLALNDLCRKLGKKFYAAGCHGLGGYIFVDLEVHEYITERANPSAAAEKKRVKNRQTFAPLSKTLEHSWKGLDARKLQRLRLSPALWGTWALWEQKARADSKAAELNGEAEVDGSALAPGAASAKELESIADELMAARGIDPASVFVGLPGGSSGYFESLAVADSMPGDFAPTSAIIGGVLAQDMLNALGGREEPLCNWFTLDGLSGQAPVYQIAVGPSEVVPA